MNSHFKSERIHSKAIRDAARGEDCLLRVPGICRNERETVVVCHSNFQEDGHGKGIKADDLFVAFGCVHCHAYLDGRLGKPPGRDEARDLFHRGMKRTWARLVELGVIQVKGYNL